MQQLFLLTDYQDRFGTKYDAVPYRGGMDKELLKAEFMAYGFDVQFMMASVVFDRVANISGKVFLYTSAEDRNGIYKSFLEDVILSIEEMKGIVIPRYICLHSHNNKVFTELIRREWGEKVGDNLQSQCFGSLEELKRNGVRLSFPVVVKCPEGFKSRGVFLAKDMRQLMQIASSISRTPDPVKSVKDLVRTFIHKGFMPESVNRKKFLIQQFIPGLNNDWKVIAYGSKFYVLFRQNRKNDFRASGSGFLSFPTELPEGLLDFAERVKDYFNVPCISLDIAHHNGEYNVLEVQFLYFGTYTIQHSDFCFKKDKGEWRIVKENPVLEKEYARSIFEFMNKNGFSA